MSPYDKQNCARHDEKIAKVLCHQTKKPGVMRTENSLEIVRACEGLCWNHDKSTPHRSETNGTAENRVRGVKEGTCALMVQSGIAEKRCGEAMECFCCLRKKQTTLQTESHGF